MRKYNTIIIFLLSFTAHVMAQYNPQTIFSKMQGHWRCKYVTGDDERYNSHFLGHKLHIFPNRIYSKLYADNYEDTQPPTFISKKDTMYSFKDVYKIDKQSENKVAYYFQKFGIVHQAGWFMYLNVFPYNHYIYLNTQKDLIIIPCLSGYYVILERDTTTYLFCKGKRVNIRHAWNKPSMNYLLEDEEVEVLKRDMNGWVYIRYWGKMLLEGWVKASELKPTTQIKEYWNLYKKNKVMVRVKENCEALREDPDQVNDYSGSVLKFYTPVFAGDEVEVLYTSTDDVYIRFRDKEGKIREGDIDVKYIEW